MSLTTNLVSYWKLDGNSTDSFGSNNGSDTGVTYSNSFGKINQGVQSTGNSEFITIASNSSLNFTAALTVSAWFNPQDAINNEKTIFVKYISSTWTGGNGGSILLRIDTTNGRVVAAVQNGSGQQAWVYSIAMSVGTWYFIALTWDGTTGTIYFNGVSESTLAFSGAIPTAAFAAEIACNTLSGIDGAKYVDEVGLWSRALTSAEITQLYNSGSGLQYPFTTGLSVHLKTLLGVGT